jgi:glucosylceramidase
MTRIDRRSFLHTVTAASLAPLAARAAAQELSAHLWISTPDGAHRMSGPTPIPFGQGSGASGTDAGRIYETAVDPARTGQTMLGLGSSLEHSTCWNLSLLDPVERQRVVERIVHPERGIGMNLMRVCIGTPDFTGEPWYSYNDLPPGETDPELKRFSIEKDRAYILPVLRLALQANPALLYFASPWSPPGWMKTTGSLTGGSVKPEWYPTYAQYFVRFVQAYAAEGIPIYAVTVQNEPGVDRARSKDPRWHYPSCGWTAEQERDFIRDHLGPAFRRTGLETQVWCYDHNYNETRKGDDPGIDYPRTIMRDARAASFVDGVAFHGYAGDASGMSVFRREFPDVPLYFTEGSVFGLRGGIDLIERLRHHASSYNAWVTMLDDDRKPNNGPFQASRTIVTINPTTTVVTEHFDFDLYGHFMKFIARGAVRLESAAAADGLANVAFRNPDGRVVVILVNEAKRARPVRLRWNGRVAETTIRPQSVATVAWTA